MADPLVDVTVRVYADFAADATLAEVLTVVRQCGTDLDTPSAAALPELVERLARQRLADHLASPAAGNGQLVKNTKTSRTGDAGTSAAGAPSIRTPIP